VIEGSLADLVRLDEMADADLEATVRTTRIARLDHFALSMETQTFSAQT